MFRFEFNSASQNIVAASALVASALLASGANAQTLYNGSLGSTPSAQGWLALGNVDAFAAPTATETYNSEGGYTTLDSSTAAPIYAGYSNYNLGGTEVNAGFPALDPTQGFTLDFTVQVNSELSTPTSSSANPRAGLSVILLDSQHQGIELGFDTNSIFSQSSDFTSASEFATTALPDSLTNYALTITGSTYTLSSGLTTLLIGAIKQYSGPAAVYNESNFLFIGDDTTANGGSFNFQSASINAGSTAAAPEPGACALISSGLGILLCGVFRRRYEAIKKPDK